MSEQAAAHAEKWNVPLLNRLLLSVSGLIIVIWLHNSEETESSSKRSSTFTTQTPTLTPSKLKKKEEIFNEARLDEREMDWKQSKQYKQC